MYKLNYKYHNVVKFKYLIEKIVENILIHDGSFSRLDTIALQKGERIKLAQYVQICME